MNRDCKRSYKNLIPKWLLAVILVLSFFSYSGITFADQYKPQTYQTNLQKDPEARLTKCIAYNRALARKVSKYCPSAPSFKTASILLGRKLAIRLINHSTPCLPVYRTGMSYRAKIITPNSSDSAVAG
jgi:hypothetical protein